MTVYDSIPFACIVVNKKTELYAVKNKSIIEFFLGLMRINQILQNYTEIRRK